MYKVVLVDDEPLILSGLMRVVPWQQYGCEVVGSANDGIEGAALIREKQPHILFTDIRMANMDGLSMIAGLKSEFPGMQIAVLTAFRDFEYAQRAIRLGVMRYLLKPSKMDEIRETIEAMTRALGALPPDEAEQADEGDDSAAGSANHFVVNQALEYIAAHAAERIALSDVADHVYVSQWHLSKLINKQTGQSFSDLINHQRVQSAKEQLRDPALRVHEIAERVGFADVAHFSKIFKKLTGETPGEYRNNLR